MATTSSPTHGSVVATHSYYCRHFGVVKALIRRKTVDRFLEKPGDSPQGDVIGGSRKKCNLRESEKMNRMGPYGRTTKAGHPVNTVSCSIVSRDSRGLKVRCPVRKSSQKDNCWHMKILPPRPTPNHYHHYSITLDCCDKLYLEVSLLSFFIEFHNWQTKSKYVFFVIFNPCVCIYRHETFGLARSTNRDRSYWQASFPLVVEDIL